MDIERLTMKSTKKAPYQAPGMGDLDLYLERGILTGSELETPNTSTDATNEGVYWVSDY